MGHAISNLALGVGQSFLCRREGVGHVFFINHISKCSGPPPPILFDQSLKVAKFLNVEHEDQSKLVVARFVVQRSEEEISKLKEVEIVPYLTDVRKLLLEKSSPGIKDGGKTKSVPSDTKPTTVSNEESVHKLLTTSALRRQFKINAGKDRKA